MEKRYNSDRRRYQVLRNKTLRIITQANWCVRNAQIRRELNEKTLEEQTEEYKEKSIEKLKHHENAQMGKIT